MCFRTLKGLPAFLDFQVKNIKENNIRVFEFAIFTVLYRVVIFSYIAILVIKYF